MAQKKSTEPERSLTGLRAGRHTDTVKRFTEGLNVTETTREAIENACHELGFEHIVCERLRALAAREGQS